MERVRLYGICAACEGHGRLAPDPSGSRTELCPKCRGKGLAPTREGRSIVALLKAAGAMELLDGDVR